MNLSDLASVGEIVGQAHRRYKAEVIAGHMHDVRRCCLTPHLICRIRRWRQGLFAENVLSRSDSSDGWFAMQCVRSDVMNYGYGRVRHERAPIWGMAGVPVLACG